MLKDSVIAVLIYWVKREKEVMVSTVGWLPEQTMALLGQVLLLEITSRYEVWGLFQRGWGWSHLCL